MIQIYYLIYDESSYTKSHEINLSNILGEKWQTVYVIKIIILLRIQSTLKRKNLSAIFKENMILIKSGFSNLFTNDGAEFFSKHLSKLQE